MKYLKCEKCGFYNDASSERLVFCKNCSVKLSNCYLEWKKHQYDKLHIPVYPDTHSGIIRTLFRSAIFTKIGIKNYV